MAEEITIGAAQYLRGGPILDDATARALAKTGVPKRAEQGSWSAEALVALGWLA